MAYPVEVKSGGKIAISLSCNATVNSDVVDIQRGNHICFDVFVNNTNSVGTIEFQGCNDLERTTPNWIAITLSDGATNIATASGVNTNALVDFADVGCKFIRVKYTRTSGNAVMDVAVHVKA